MRVNVLREMMGEYDGFLLVNPKNIGYVIGFTPGFPALLFVPKRGEVVLVVSRGDAELARENCKVRVEVAGEGGYARKLREVAGGRLGRVMVEDSLESGLLSRFREELPHVSFESSDVMMRVRSVKSKGELERIVRAAKIAERGLEAAVGMVDVGVRECEVAAEAEYAMRRAGAEGFPFDTIVASGKRGANPHATCSTRRIRKGDLVVIDLGAKYGGYCSDVTRTVVLGGGKEKVEMLTAVIEAQEAAVNAVKPGVSAKEVDRAARSILEERGYGECFTHSLGHGVGLDVHELPHISPVSEAKLKEGMVFTVEPGVYILRVGGVRVEDMVVVEKRGAKVLTRRPKDLIFS